MRLKVWGLRGFQYGYESSLGKVRGPKSAGVFVLDIQLAKNYSVRSPKKRDYNRKT
jgi:hypothetical protein